MISKVESFWIKFILRFAIGFLFLFAALGQFYYGGADTLDGPRVFAENLSRGFASTWLADGNRQFQRARFVLVPLQLAPIFTGLAVLILTGIFVRPALRLGAILLVCLGLGKYMQGPEGIATTANDFLFALIICIGLFFYGLERRPAPEASRAAA